MTDYIIYTDQGYTEDADQKEVSNFQIIGFTTSFDNESPKEVLKRFILNGYVPGLFTRFYIRECVGMPRKFETDLQLTEVYI